MAWLSIAGATLVGAGLRLFRLDQQVLTGDELHGLNGALARTTAEIVREWTYFGADYCIPLTALTRIAMDAGLVVDEALLRAPVLLAGIATVCVLPALWMRSVGGRSAALMAWLLALSPLLVLYGRIARSYAPAVLLAWAAVAAFELAWRAHSRAAAVAYATCAALAVYFHLGTAPLVLAPLVWAAGTLVSDSRRPGGGGRSEWLRLAGLSLVTLFAIAVPLWPARESLLALPGLEKSGQVPGFATWLDVVRLQTGTALTALSLCVVAAAARGLVLLLRRDAALAALLVVVMGVQAAAILVARPYLLESLVVVNRYVLFLLPGWLLLAAHGLATMPDSGPAWLRRHLRRHGWVVGAAAVALLFVAGPLTAPGFRSSVFAHSNPSVIFVRPPDAVSPGLVPSFYRDLGAGDASILEYPGANVATHAFDAYQRLHGRPVVLGSANPLHDDDRLALRTLWSARPDAFRASGARYVVVHLDLQREEGAVVTSEFLHRKRVEELGPLWSALRAAGASMARRLQAEWGDPIYSDAQIRVWDTQGTGSSRPGSPGLSSEAPGG
jgi:hypothetical protein